MGIIRRILAFCLSLFMIAGGIGVPAEVLSYASSDTAQHQSEIIARDEIVAHELLGRLYRNMLGREGERTGIDAWTEALKDGRYDGYTIFDGFYYSQEFMRINDGMNDEQYVTMLYHTILGREPDADGLDSWLAVLANNQATRESVYKDFIKSEEWTRIVNSNYIFSGHYAMSLFVDRLYYVTLGRNADPEGKADWMERLINGMSGYEIAVGFFASREYQGKHPTTEETITSIYRTMLDRDPDAEGMNTWTNCLETASLEETLMGVAGSVEFARLCEDAGISPLPPPPEEPQTGREIDPNRPMIAITFDDGPGQYTSLILDCLEENGQAATFFVVGTNIERFPEIVTRADSIGCEIGSHTYSHGNLNNMSASAIQNEITRTDNLISDATGHVASIMRPPYGSHNQTVRNNVGKPLILWNVDTEDWRTRSTQSTVNSVLNNAHDGAIILMHDIHKSTVDAALIFIPELVARGYQLVTVSELASYRGGMESGTAYRSFRP